MIFRSPRPVARCGLYIPSYERNRAKRYYFYFIFGLFAIMCVSSRTPHECVKGSSPQQAYTNISWNVLTSGKASSEHDGVNPVLYENSQTVHMIECR